MSIISTTTILIILSLLTVTTEAGSRLVGGRSEVKNVESNKEIQELGRFALEEYKRMTMISGKYDDKESVKGLRFVRVVSAEKQVVSGLKYHMKVEVVSEDGVRKLLFDSVVVVKPWVKKKSRELVGFTPARNDDVVVVVDVVNELVQ